MLDCLTHPASLTNRVLGPKQRNVGPITLHYKLIWQNNKYLMKDTTSKNVHLSHFLNR